MAEGDEWLLISIRGNKPDFSELGLMRQSKGE